MPSCRHPDHARRKSACLKSFLGRLGLRNRLLGRARRAVRGQPDFRAASTCAAPSSTRGATCRAQSTSHTARSLSPAEPSIRPDTVFVVYCAGPHCNGGHKGAIRFARLGRPVKLMIGGVTGWLDEGFELAQG